jgi:trehalose 6-phosphate synthase
MQQQGEAMSAAYFNPNSLPKTARMLTHLPPNSQHRRLVVVSNRLPVKFTHDGQAELSSGGLVTAMVPVLNKRGGLWLGWPGTWGDLGPELDKFSQGRPYSLQPVTLTREDMEGFYTGFANQVLWPLFHGFQTKCVFDSCFWEAYDRVNAIFAREVAAKSSANDYIWIHDYHLINVAQKIKESGTSRECGFYLHIPFPPPDIFLQLPWRKEILAGLLEYDLIGFQTQWDLDNFLRTVKTLFPESWISSSHPLSVVKMGGKRTQAGSFPISIDFDEFSKQAATAEPGSVKPDGVSEQQTALGVDRLDYSKGIPERLKAFRLALEQYPKLRKKISLVQIVVPSREDVAEYQRLKKEIERLVGEINGEYATLDWTPVQYLYRSLTRQELVARYEQADMALITPLRDGMNLVAKEYCACKNSLAGVLILSEFTGAAAQLRSEALSVNPCDIDSLAHAIHRACTMPLQERKRRMRAARQKIKSQDIYWWLESFLAAALRTGEVRLRRRERPKLDFCTSISAAHKTISI